MARQALRAADTGHKWLVAGYPGPVSADGKRVGPLTNVPGFARSESNVSEEMVAAEPAVGRLVDSGFVIVNTNDGSLAAQAAASRMGEHKFSKVAALIDGTGTGAGIVAADGAHVSLGICRPTIPLGTKWVLVLVRWPQLWELCMALTWWCLVVVSEPELRISTART
ncbi:MAG TPA: hypothetical protein VLA92_01510 [Candidatus Saccharimonadales bacterium]|nr:hypothetical protein [Candidatus Saccharimonadales bacterium]